MGAFSRKLRHGDHQVIEFGGKPFGDHHVERVLPGYDPDIKARILQDLSVDLGSVSIAMTVNAKDILHAPDGRRVRQRIRGDSGLRYDDEAIRLARQARDEFNIPVDRVVLAALPQVLSAQNEDYIANYKQRLVTEGLGVRSIRAIAGYPYLGTDSVRETLTQDMPVSNADHLIIVSPGGGSGKFGVAITQIAHFLASGDNPNFVKFETFPVFHLPVEHPLNVAFLAATADLPNELIETASGATNYDKDVQNLALLRGLMSHYRHLDSPLHEFREPTDMGVNTIESGIRDEGLVAQACMAEIARRLNRYKNELKRGDESPEAVARVEEYLS